MLADNSQVTNSKSGSSYMTGQLQIRRVMGQHLQGLASDTVKLKRALTYGAIGGWSGSADDDWDSI